MVRLLLEIEQILLTGDLDLELHREQLKEIRRGGWTLEQLEEWAKDKEGTLEKAYLTSSLPAAPDEALLKRHLVHCLELHYGDLTSAVHVPDDAVALLHTIATLTDRYR